LDKSKKSKNTAKRFEKEKQKQGITFKKHKNKSYYFQTSLLPSFIDQ